MTAPTLIVDEFATFMRHVGEIKITPITFPPLADVRKLVDVETVDVETEVPEYRHDFTAEIEAGVATLDTALGRDVWLPRVNLATLNLAVEDSCVAAQTTGITYFKAIEVLGEDVFTYDWGDVRGFTVDDLLCDEYGEATLYAQLTEQWKAKITELRAEASA